MKRYAAWQAPFYSLWSKSFYLDVAKNWHGLAYGYLFALICFTWIFMSVKKQIDMAYFAENELYPLADQMPKTTIDKGMISIDKPCPFTLSNNHGSPVVTFDTREKHMELNDIPGSFLVTKDGIYYKSNVTYRSDGSVGKITNDQTANEKLEFSSIDHQVIDRNSARQFVSDFCNSIGVIVFMIAVPLAFLFCSLQTLLYALMGMLIARLNKVKLPYGTLIRLSAVALTPVLLIDSIVKVRGLDTEMWPVWPLLAFFVSLAYLIFAVTVNIVNQDNNPELSNS